MLLLCSDPISTASMDAKVTNMNYTAILNLCLLFASLTFATTFVVGKMKKNIRSGLGLFQGRLLGGQLESATSNNPIFSTRFFGSRFARTDNNPRASHETVSYTVRVAGIMSRSFGLMRSQFRKTREDFAGTDICLFFHDVDARFYRCFVFLKGKVSALHRRCSQWPQACVQSVDTLTTTFCGQIRTILRRVQLGAMCRPIRNMAAHLCFRFYQLTWLGAAFMMQCAQWLWACVRSIPARLATFDEYIRMVVRPGLGPLCAKFLLMLYNQPLYLIVSIAESVYALLRALGPQRSDRNVQIVHANGVCGTYSGYGRGTVRFSVSSTEEGLSFFSGDRFTGPSIIKPMNLPAGNTCGVHGVGLLCAFVIAAAAAALSLVACTASVMVCLAAGFSAFLGDLTCLFGNKIYLWILSYWVTPIEPRAQRTILTLRDNSDDDRAHTVIHWSQGYSNAWRIMVLYSLLSQVEAGDDSVSGTSSRLPKFDGQRSSYRTWLLAFSAFVSLRYPDLVGIIDGTRAPPTPESDEATRDLFLRHNRQVYGAIAQCIPDWLVNTLYMSSPNDGRAALLHLRTEYGITTPMDRAAAMTAIHQCMMDPRAAIDINHVRFQYDHMREANSNLVQAGGQALPDATLITLLDAAIARCPSYNHIRMFVSRSRHETFLAHFNDYIQVVRSEMQMNDLAGEAHQHPSAYAAIPPHAGRRGGPGLFEPRLGKGKGKGGGKGKGKGSKGKSKGKGNLGTIIMCFRCARIGHSRVDCKMAPVRCSQCGGDHSDTLHTKSDLTVGQRRALMNDAQSRGRAAGRPVAAAAIPFEDFGGDSVPELSRAVNDQLGYDDADINDDSGAMVRFAVAIPFGAENQMYATMPVSSRIERMADVALIMPADEVPGALSGATLGEGDALLGSDATHEAEAGASSTPDPPLMTSPTPTSNFKIGAELHRQDLMLACMEAAIYQTTRDVLGGDLKDVHEKSRIFRDQAADAMPGPSGDVYTDKMLRNLQALELFLDEEADPVIYAGPGSGEVITEDDDSLPELDRHERFERQRLAAIHRMFVQASSAGLKRSVIRRAVESWWSAKAAEQAEQDFRCHESEVGTYGMPLCGACKATLPCDCEEDFMEVDIARSVSPPALKIGTHSSSSYVKSLALENIFPLEHKTYHDLDRHETCAINALWQERCDDACISLADLSEAVRLSLLCPPRDEVMQSVDILVIILHNVYAFGGPKCMRPDCPCTSTFSGVDGANCCQTCFFGKPCRSNVHPTPFTPRQIPKLPPFVALVCTTWRHAWDITQMEWVMDREYPAALYWLAGVVQRVSTRAVVSAEAIVGRLEREAASRAEHNDLDISPPTSVVVEQLHMENVILLEKSRQEHGSEESVGTDEHIAQLVAHEGNLYAAARVYERLITPSRIISPVSITMATSILSTHSPDETADRLLAAQVHEAVFLDGHTCTSTLALQRLAQVPHIVSLSDYLSGPDTVPEPSVPEPSFTVAPAATCPHPTWVCDCGETSNFLCSCFPPEPQFCDCWSPRPAPAATAFPAIPHPSEPKPPDHSADTVRSSRPLLDVDHDHLALNVAVRDSFIAPGVGLFARQNFKEGQVVICMRQPGHARSKRETASWLEKNSLPNCAAIPLNSRNWFFDEAEPTLGSYEHVPWRAVNDAFPGEPNLAWSLFKKKSIGSSWHIVPALVAIRPIFIGDELTYEYADTSYRGLLANHESLTLADSAIIDAALDELAQDAMESLPHVDQLAMTDGSPSLTYSVAAQSIEFDTFDDIFSAPLDMNDESAFAFYAGPLLAPKVRTLQRHFAVRTPQMRVPLPTPGRRTRRGEGRGRQPTSYTAPRTQTQHSNLLLGAIWIVSAIFIRIESVTWASYFMNVILILFIAYVKWPQGVAQGYHRGMVDPARRCNAHAMEGGVAYPATGRHRNANAPGDLPRAPNTRRVLVLFSGPQRDDDIGACLRSAGVAVTEFDLVRGDDLLDKGTRLGLMRSATEGSYGVVFAAPPCSTFSVARLQYSSGPPQLRSMLHPRGLPGLPSTEAKIVEVHNRLVEYMIAIMSAAASKGAAIACENPVPRGDPNSPFYQTGLADHSSLWDMPEVRRVMSDLYMVYVDFPQCALHADFQKYTRLAFSPALLPMLQRLTSLRCNHRSHASVANGFDEDGNSRGQMSSHYPPAMSALLAQAFATEIFNQRDTMSTFAPAVRVNLPSDRLPRPVAAPGPPNALIKTLHIDTMAPFGVTSTPSAIVRVQEIYPNISIAGIAGSIPILAIVTIGFHVRRKATDDRWMYLEIPDCYYAPQSTIELYPVQHCFDLLGWRHAFDDVCTITVTGGYTIPFTSQPGRGFHVQVAYDTRRLARLPPALISASSIPNPTGGHQAAMAYPAQPVTNVGIKPRTVDLVWRRLGYPSTEVWRHVHSATVNSGVSAGSPAPTYSSPEERLAVARGRMRAGAFPGNHLDDPPEEPLMKLYMDFAGPTAVASHIHGYRHYCGVTDGYSGLTRVYGCRAPTAAVAVYALQQFLIYARVLLKSAIPVTPIVVRTDQGAAFTSAVFAEYIRSLSAELSLAVVYTPQQNSPIERAWGSIFNTARILLYLSNLSPVWHSFAIYQATLLRNIWPVVEKKISRHQIFTGGSVPDVKWLRAFGCAVEAYLGKEQRYSADRKRDVPLGKKLVDHAAAGIYLGSAYPTPGHVVYFLKARTIRACVHVAFDETSFPGIPDTPLESDTDLRISNRDKATPQPPPAAPKLMPAADLSAPPSFVLQPPPVILPPTAPRPVMAGGREHPLRDARTGPFGYTRTLNYTDPTDATREQAEDNFALLSSLATRVSPAYAYQSPVGDAQVIRPDSDPGEIRIPTNYAAAMSSPESEYWRAALVKELSGLLEKKTWHVIRLLDMPEGSNLMNCHLVFSVKRNADGSIDKFKVRVVVNGQTQKHGVDFDRVFSTVVKMSTVRLLLTIACKLSMSLSSLDVVQAYLHAKLDRPLYMRVPPGLPRTDSNGDKLICCLDKSLYGLRQAAREWNKLFVAFLLEWGFVQSSADTCLFHYSALSRLVMLIVIWVDDIICADADAKIRITFAKELAKKFPIEEKTELTWVLGIKVKRDLKVGSLALSQELYIKDMLRKHAPHLSTTGRKFDSPMADDVHYTPDQCPSENSPEAEEMWPLRETYMSVVGALLWLAACTRPDITYATSVLARFVSNPARLHYSAMQRVLSYLQTTQDRPFILCPGGKLGVVVYADASWDEKFSVSGGLVYFDGSLIVWYSRKQRTVAHSSAEAEYISASLAAREGAHVRSVLTELNLLPTGPSPLRLDSKSAIDMAHDPVAFKKTKHIMRESHYLRDLVARRVYRPEHVVSAEQLADILTKALGRVLFVRLRDLLLAV